MIIYVPGYASEMNAHKLAVEAEIGNGATLTGPTQPTTQGEDVFLLATLTKPDPEPGDPDPLDPPQSAMRRTRRKVTKKPTKRK